MGKILLYDVNGYMCASWLYYFKDCNDVVISQIPFDKVKASHVVTAGNSYGLMTGGIDLAVRNYFGQRIQDTIQHELFFKQQKLLDVGSSICVATGDKDKPNLIYAPTMEIPKTIDKSIVYKVTYHILKEYLHLAKELAICGLGTNTGGVSYEDAAREMYQAYNDIKLIKKPR